MSICELPSNRCRTVLEEIAKQEGFIKYDISVTKGFTLGENFSGEVLGVAITENNSDDKPKSLHLIVKVSLKIPQLREGGLIQCIYKREAYIYQKMLPTLYECQKNLPEDERFEFAKLYKTVLEDDEEIIVMEDMSNKGYRMLDRMKPFNYEQLVICIKALARFHATSFVLKAKQPEVYDEIFSIAYDSNIIRNVFRAFVASRKESMRQLIENEPYKEAIGAVLDNLAEDFDRLFDLSNEYSVLIHGDSWNNNILFHEKDGKLDMMVFVDWQLTRNGAPIIDLSYILMIGIDSQMRSKHYEEMLDLYYEVLSSNVTKMAVDLSMYYPPEVYRKQVTDYMKFGLLAAFGALPVILANKDEAQDLEKYFENFGEEEFVTSTPISKTARMRLKELFEDCVKYKII